MNKNAEIARPGGSTSFDRLKCAHLSQILWMETFVHSQKRKKTTTISVCFHLHGTTALRHSSLWTSHTNGRIHTWIWSYCKLLETFLRTFSQLTWFVFLSRVLCPTLSSSSLHPFALYLSFSFIHSIFPRDVWIHYFFYSRSLFSHLLFTVLSATVKRRLYNS